MYSRTQNENGSYNSRCLDCFMTIASCVETEKELDEREAHHMCPEKALAQLLAQDRAAAAHAARN
jgi:ABC-type Fe3+-citrate transport system substrate-binding protein